MNIDKTDLQQLIHQYSIEIVPKTLRQIGDIRPWLAPGTEVYVPNLRGHKISDTIDACAQLQSQHMQAVPHLALRNIASEDELRHTLDRITALGIRRILVLAGGAKEPLGPYGSVKDLMKTGILQTYPFEHIGFAGHPEGSPDIPPDEQEAAEAQKQGYALTYPHDYYLTTQFCFQIAPITAWLDRLRVERDELAAKVDKLAAFLDSGKPCQGGAQHLELMREQLFHMTAYRDLLNQRLELAEGA